MSDSNTPENAKPIVVITGMSGHLGGDITKALTRNYQVIGMDKEQGSSSLPFIKADLTDDQSLRDGLNELRSKYGTHIASVIHLAAYFDFTGDDNPLYHDLNVAGTRRLLAGLQAFEVGQFVYSGTMLVHAPVEPGERIDEARRIDPQWIYPQSKAAAEEVIRKEHGSIPFVLLHLAGLYDDETLVPTVAHQVARIYERDLESHVYPGNLQTGQSMVHGQDLSEAFRRVVDRRADLPDEITILIGEPDPVGYADLQDRLGELIHGEEWVTLRIPATLAAAGAWVEEKVTPHLPESLGGGKSFIRPFMAMEASDHYALDISRAHDLLDWSPHHHMIDALPAQIATLKQDPKAWYKANKIGPPASAGQ